MDNVAPRRFSPARRVFFSSIEWICRGLGGRHFYRIYYLTPPRLRVRVEEVVVSGFARELDGFSIVQLTDLHGGPFLRARDLERVIDAANALAPDAIAITGDFLTHRTEEALELAPAFAKLRARKGIFAIFGNHDYRGRREGEIERALAANGVTTLRNASRLLAENCYIAGVEDLEEGKYPDFNKALAGIPAGAAVVLLCHHPAGLEFAAPRGVSLVLSGHTHGTQIRLPIVRNLGPAHEGDRLQSGPTTLIVSHGIGAIGVPLRVGTRAEIVYIKLRAR
ncbi:MAG: metallophosphoesterase [Planctomycetes bacterium]|nr:metallophosphoesterase [Planctomycetota bacterium]